MVEDGTLQKLVSEFSSPKADGKSYIADRKEWFEKRMANIRPLLSKESLSSLTMDDAKRVYKEMSVGGPKLYLRTFAENGIEKIRAALLYLLYDDSKPLGDRFFNFVSNRNSEYRVKGAGRDFASTALLLTDPNKYAIWNGAVDGGLKKLGMLPKKERGETIGTTYLKVTAALKQLQEKCGLEDLGLVDEFVELIFHKKLGGELLRMQQPLEQPLPSTAEKAAAAFMFTNRDFDACTGRKSDAQHLYKRFKELKDVLLSRLTPDIQEFTKAYAAHPYNRGKQAWLKYMWLGVAHSRLRGKPQSSVQFQVGINSKDPFAIDLFIDDKAVDAKKRARLNIEANMHEFLARLNSLEGYVLGNTDELEASQVDEEHLGEFLKGLDDREAYAYISKRMTRKETIGKRETITQTILGTWRQLLPLYEIMAFGKTAESRPRNTRADIKALIETEGPYKSLIRSSLAHIAAGKNLVLYGAPATSKTYLVKAICDAICSDRCFQTANSEWSYFDIVGGLVPQGTTTQFKEGILLEATEKCKTSVEEGRGPCWLIIDELNRANLDLAFGKIFTQLDLDYRDSPLETIREGEKEKKYFMPQSFRILSTMNTYDRSLLFSLGYAFMRRFAFVPVESLLTDKDEAHSEQGLGVVENAQAILAKENMQHLKAKTIDVVYKHFSQTGPDVPYIFAYTGLRDKTHLENILAHELKIGDLDVLDVFLLIAHSITNEGLVEVGHAIVFDAAKFMVAYTLLFPESIAPLLILDEAIEAYVLPQLEYFMPKLRRQSVLERQTSKGWEAVKQLVKALGLGKTSARIQKAEEEFRVIL